MLTALRKPLICLQMTNNYLTYLANSGSSSCSRKIDTTTGLKNCFNWEMSFLFLICQLTVASTEISRYLIFSGSSQEQIFLELNVYVTPASHSFCFSLISSDGSNGSDGGSQSTHRPLHLDVFVPLCCPGDRAKPSHSCENPLKATVT